MRKKLIALLIVAILSTSLYGCTNEKATITTTVYAVKYLVEQLAGDKVNVEYLSNDEFIQRATIVSNYEEILSKTTLLLYIGELEPYFDVYSELLEKYEFDVINLASLSAIYDFKRYTTLIIDDVKVVKESEYYEDSVFDNIDTYNKDPFIWLDPIAMSSMASTIKDWLCQYYPEETLVFENNFKTLQATFVRMDAEFQELRNYSDIKVVTVTASFGNWQKIYGVQVYPLTISKYGTIPTDEQLEVIEEQIKTNKIKYIIYDRTLPEDLLTLYQTIKDKCNLIGIELSSLSRLAAPDIEKDKSYTTIMYENLTNLEKVFK